ncbi:MAG: glycosyl transferase family 1 [Erythrobacter sp. SCN 62-14]|nr:MAG: glycosyl transferase family 1 [Erythrobacter sp. SCN 62-14]
MKAGDEILFLAHRVPFPPNRGDKIRAHHLLKALAAIAPVHVGCLSESDEDRAGLADLAQIAASHCAPARPKPLVLAGIEAVAQGKPVSLTAFHSRRLESWVREIIAKRPIGAIVVFSGQMGQYVPAHFPGRVIIDLCDVDSAKFAQYAANGERVWLNAREARLLAREEERLGARADATILISEAEAALYRQGLQDPARVNVQVIGNGIDARLFDPAKVKPHPAMASLAGPHFTFTGQMDYRPNEQAAIWAIEHLLPALRAHWASAEIHIVGRNPTPALLALKGRAGANIWGEVPDVRPFIAASDCVIAPLMIARGVQNKVLEAMAMARPVLLTPEAATGIAARDGADWLIERADPAAMAARAAALLGDPQKTAAMGAAARAFVLESHAWPAMLAPLGAMLNTALQGARHAA